MRPWWLWAMTASPLQWKLETPETVAFYENNISISHSFSRILHRLYTSSCSSFTSRHSSLTTAYLLQKEWLSALVSCRGIRDSCLPETWCLSSEGVWLEASGMATAVTPAATFLYNGELFTEDDYNFISSNILHCSHQNNHRYLLNLNFH